MNWPPSVGILAALATFALGVACTAGSQQPGSPPPEPGVPSLLLGQGGGFTGAQEGFWVGPDGKVSRWQRLPGKREITTPLGTLSPTQRQQMAAMLETLDLAKVPPGEPGNMSSFLELTTPTGTKTFVWPGLYQDAPEPLRPLVNLLLPWFQSLEKGQP